MASVTAPTSTSQNALAKPGGPTKGAALKRAASTSHSAPDGRAKRGRVDASAPSTSGGASQSPSIAPAPVSQASHDQPTKLQHKGKETRDGRKRAEGKGKGKEESAGKGKRKQDAAAEGEDAPKKAYKVRKLDPPRPWPTVPTSVNASGPRSSHHEGKNYICLTRKTELGAYLRRCKDLVIKDGYKTLHLSALGAAIPLLAQLALSLPAILPHAPAEVRTDVFTGTVEVRDELVPEDEEEDIAYQTRGKSALRVVLTIGDGEKEAGAGSHDRNRSERQRGRRRGRRGKGNGEAAEEGEIVEEEDVVYMQEPEQEDE